MKKYVMGFIIGVIVCLSFQSFASNIFQAQQATFEVFIKGDKLASDKPIVAIEGSTYLPLKDIGTALGVPVDWNADKRRVEIDMRDSKVGTLSNIKSNSLDIDANIPYEKVVTKDGNYYVAQLAFSKYIKLDSGKFYLQLPGDESKIIKGESTIYATEIDGRIYINLDACGIKYTVDGDTLILQ